MLFNNHSQFVLLYAARGLLCSVISSGLNELSLVYLMRVSLDELSGMELRRDVLHTGEVSTHDLLDR